MEIKPRKTSQKIDGKNLKISIIVPYFNEEIALELLENSKKELIENNVKEKNISIVRVEGALEIPFACQKIIEKEKPNGIIALGAVIRGETSHYDLVCENSFSGMMQVQLKTGVPIAFGILTCENVKQAKTRASKNGENKGKQIAQAILLQTTL